MSVGMEYFGEKLKALRKSKRLTQAALASRVGVANGTITAYETGLKYPSIEMLIKLCDTLDGSSDYLLGISDETPLKMGGLTDEQMQLFLQLMAIVEQYNNIKERPI